MIKTTSRCHKCRLEVSSKTQKSKQSANESTLYILVVYFDVDFAELCRPADGDVAELAVGLTLVNDQTCVIYASLAHARPLISCF